MIVMLPIVKIFDIMRNSVPDSEHRGIQLLRFPLVLCSPGFRYSVILSSVAGIFT